MKNKSGIKSESVDNHKPLSRRKFLKTMVIGAGGMTVLCSGLGVAALSKPRIEYYSAYDSKSEEKSEKILVAYGSVCGSTGEVAKAIAEELQISGFSVDVLPMQDIKNLDAYQTLVLGSANRMGRLCQHTRQFISKFGNEMASKQTAYFDVGLTMKEDTTEHREEALKYIQPLIDLKEPISTEVFAGKLDLSKVEYGLQLALQNDTSGTMEEGDFRNWEKIRAWGQQLAMQLQNA